MLGIKVISMCICAPFCKLCGACMFEVGEKKYPYTDFKNFRIETVILTELGLTRSWFLEGYNDGEERRTASWYYNNLFPPLPPLSLALVLH